MFRKYVFYAILVISSIVARADGDGYRRGMTPYRDSGGDSGIVAYEYGDNWIRIGFRRGGTFDYHATVIGYTHLDNMKALADGGEGLNRYINQHPDVKRGAARVD